MVVGAGPAGLAAATRAHECAMSVVLLERSAHLADTVYCYQKGKHVMAEPSLVPLRTSLPFASGSREVVLERWERFARDTGLDVRHNQEVRTIDRVDDGFVAHSTDGSRYAARRVILAVGTQGNPNRLGVPGEDLPHVKTRLVDPKDHENEDIVVIGAGDSALEIAIALSERNRVSLVVRRSEIVKAKEANEREALSRHASGRLQILFSTSPTKIAPGIVHLRGAEQDFEVRADAVYVKVGAQPPRRWLEKLGVGFASAEPGAAPLLTHGHESRTVPGLYLIGAVAGRDLVKLGINQAYEVIEHIAGRQVVPADEEILLPKLPFGGGTVSDRIDFLQRVIPLFADTEATELKDILLTISFRPSMMLQPPSRDDLRTALLSASLHVLDDGDAMMRQNDYTDSVWVLIEGEARVLRRDESGEEQEVAKLGGGSFFGEMGLVSGRRRSATVVARGPCKLLELPRKTMLLLIDRSPRVKRMVDEAFIMRAFQNYLFPRVPADILKALAKTAEVVELARDQVVFSEGDEGDSFYFVRSGQVKVTQRSGEREIVLSYLVSGNFFGEGALFAAERRSATVTTIFPSALIRLTRQDFQQFVAAFPTLAPRFFEVFESRRIESLAAAARPGRIQILEDLIRGEVVIGTDALIIDDYKCVRCGQCVTACEQIHDDGQARLSLTGIHFANILAPNSCWQCENPLCMLDCPPDALVRDSRGEIYIRDNCIGCGNCEANCPYDNIFMVHPKPQLGPWGWIKALAGFGADDQAGRTVAVKCDLCRDLSGGPACVRSCPTGAAIRLTPEEYEETIGGLVARGRWGG